MALFTAILYIIVHLLLLIVHYLEDLEFFLQNRHKGHEKVAV